ncbi:MAG: nickel pincer cofactor biosynthesis protein LarC [Treponema sp.]|nr:nickel pincer cofactor biosynthesis protein LarC [Treponema sp.]
MKTLHFDCFAGISGDMALGALVDLGVDPDMLRQELGKLGLDGWKLEFHQDERGGIRGTHAVVDLGERHDHSACDDEQQGDHHHADTPVHGNHHHADMPLHGSHHHVHGNHCHDDTSSGHHTHEAHGDGHHGAHNSWKEIRALIQEAGISAGAKTRALAIFTRIAEAEAQVHQVPVDEVGFHEVGALDSIIDIVGTALCLDYLQPDRITCGEIELGGGTVRCAHGVLPVPAPATLSLLRGIPVKTGGFNKEMTTPTGAAILAASVDTFISSGSFTEIKTGYGIGTRRMERPNLLRVSWREAATVTETQPWQTESLVLLEANIDDMTGEALGFLMERLFDAGALDVTFTPCVMKKSRPGTTVSVLAAPGTLDPLRRTMFEHSSTIGFRELPVQRHSLKRKESRIRGGFGEARKKTVFYGETPLRSKIEYEDRARIAGEQGISLEAAEQLITG